MNIKQLSYFSAVAEHQNISRAAVSLGIPQSALSRQINQLESNLGIRLLHRHGRGVSLTTAGEKLLVHVQAILKHLDNAQNELQSLKTTPQDTTIIGFPPTVGQRLTVPLALKFQHLFPHAHLQIEEAYSGQVLEWLAAGKVDVAVVYEGPNSANILGEKLLEEQLYLIGPGTNPPTTKSEISAEFLSELPLVLPSHPHGLRVLLEQKMRQNRLSLNVAMEISGLEVTKSLVKSSRLCTVLPFAAVQKEVSDGTLVAAKIVNPELVRSLILATSTRKPLSKTTRDTVKLIRELVLNLE